MARRAASPPARGESSNGHRPERHVADGAGPRPHRPPRREGGARPGGPREDPRLPRRPRGEDRRPRDHVRRQHGDRGVLRGRPDRRAGQGLPALPHLQPRGRHRGPGAGGVRAGRDGGADQRPRARQLGLPARHHADARRDAEPGRDARRLPEGLRRRLRRPRADVAGRSPPPRGGGGDVPGRAPAGQGRDGEGGDRGPRPHGPRRPRHDQRLEPPDRDERDPPLGHRPVAEAGRDRLLHVARGALRELQALRRAAPPAARLRGGDPLVEGDPEVRRRRATSSRGS